ncbi:MAG: IS1380 family transposase [Acidobacteriaceae bacterium]|nr:IS1380 family transposase [Acidobacteriaceae bacterium]
MLATECTQSNFEFAGAWARSVVARFDGGEITSHAGGLLLQEVDRRIGLLKRLSKCFLDGREQSRVRHSVREMLAQRVYGLALGYEDLNDHEQLRQDPLLMLLAGSADAESPLAGKSTLNRLELAGEGGEEDRYKKVHHDAEAIDRVLVDIFLEAHAEPAEEIVIDLDTTDLPLHGHQEQRFFHGFYYHYCYLPLYIVCGEHLLGVRLRPANIDASAGALAEVERIVKQVRQSWPHVKIILRGDSGFCREVLMSWCEANQVDYVFGFARNERLRRIIDPQMQEAAALHAQTGQAARVFAEFAYQTNDSWSRPRRVVAKAEQIEGKENPRYLATSLETAHWPAKKLYEQLYCARGDMENRIKEQYALFAGRVSAATLRANQLRLYLSAAAYVLMSAFRRLALPGTAWARAQCETIRSQLLRIGAQVRITARKVWISIASSYPHWRAFAQAHQQLRC